MSKELPISSAVSKEAPVVETVFKTPKTPIEVRASKAISKEDFIGNEIAFLQRTKQKVPTNIQSKLSKTWNEIQTGTKLQSTIGKEIPKVEVIKPKATKSQLDTLKSKADDTFNDFKKADPLYTKQTHELRTAASINYISNNGIDNAVDVGLGKFGVSPDSGFTAPFMKSILIKSGQLTDDQIYRLTTSTSVESLAGSSLQSVTPLQTYINKHSEALRQSFKRNTVVNKKTTRSLFEGLEC